MRTVYSIFNTEKEYTVEKMIAKANQLTVSQLKYSCVQMMASTTPESDIVLDVLLDVLMGRISEAEFVEFADGL